MKKILFTLLTFVFLGWTGQALAMAPPATSICIVMPEVCSTDTVEGNLLPSVNPLVGIPVALTASVTGGSATGDISYTFYCNKNTSGTNIQEDTGPQNGKLDYLDNGWRQTGVSSSSYVFGAGGDYGNGCTYNAPGVYTAKVIIERGYAKTAAWIAFTVARHTNTVDLTASSSNAVIGGSPIILTAKVSGTATGTITYMFYCDATSSVPTFKKEASTENPYIFGEGNGHGTGCAYDSVGSKTAKVVIERGSALPTTDSRVITVAEQAVEESVFKVGLTASPVDPKINDLVALKARVTSDDSSPVTYIFYCDVSSGIADHVEGPTSDLSYAYNGCRYADVGAHTAKVIVNQGELFRSNTADITVSGSGGPAGAEGNTSPNSSGNTFPFGLGS